MSTYPIRLQASAPPPTDPRRAAALRTYLRRLASSLMPGWAPTEDDGDFGTALLEVAARLGEETTRRLDGTAERDAIAFFDFLGLSPTPPQASAGVLVLALAKEYAQPVFAPRGTQVVAAKQGGDGVTFETQRGLRVVPGRFAELIAVDPTTDRIEVAPAQVTSLKRPAAIPGSYELVTFAGTGSRTLQVSPSAGLAPEDVLRIGASAHRIETFDNGSGIVTLHDPLDAQAAAGTTLTRVGSLESFEMRNVQRHVLYIGHSELFDLEQPAEISLVFTPSGLARELTRLDVAYTMYGTKEGVAEPDWHALDLLGTDGSTVQLGKPEPGSVEKVKVHGHNNRWLRAEIRSQMNGPSTLISHASQVRVKVSSLTGDSATNTALSGADGGSGPNFLEGSRTIPLALHNGSPLSTARRFYPFGPEPLRFDVFAVAASEALSKKGATVRVDVTMVDSSLASFEITPVAAGASIVRGYGVGSNGDLQVLSFEGADGLRWHVLQLVADDGRRLLLRNASSVGLGATDADADLVVVRDRDGGIWSAKVGRAGEQAVPSVEKGTWRPLPALALASATDQGATPNGRPPGPLLLAAPTGASGVTAILLGVAEGNLFALKLDDNGSDNDLGWQPVQITGAPSPVLTGVWQVTPVQSADWPRRPDGSVLELIAIDQDGAVWFGGTTGTIDSTTQLTVTWTRLDGTGSGAPFSASADVRPAATRFRPDQGPAQLWVSYARPGTDPEKEDRILHGLIQTRMGTSEHVPIGDHIDAKIKPKTALHANPKVRGVDDRPVTVGLNKGSGEAIAWFGEDEITTIPLQSAAPTGRPLLLQTGTKQSPELVLGGTDESLFRAPISPSPSVSFTLHNVLGLESPDPPHRVEITSDPGDPATSRIVDLPESKRRIKQGNLRLFQVDEPLVTDPNVPYPTLNYLRHLEPSGPAYTATFGVANNRAEVQLDAADHVTAKGTRLIVEKASYLVTSVSSTRVATLEHALLGSDPSPQYRPAELLDTETLQDLNFDTLAELNTSTMVNPPSLRFRLGADPKTQTLTLQQPGGGSVWARLKQAWKTAPDRQGWAAVPGPYLTPTWKEDSLQRGYQNPELSWEYYDGAGWRRLELDFVDGTNNMSSSGVIRFVVPDDLTTTEIGGKEDYWIRARLIGGDYGRPSYVVRTTPIPKSTGTLQTVTVDTSRMRPPEILALEARFTLTQQIAPEILLVENNLDVLDQTQADAVQAARFELFPGTFALDVDMADRALYVGLTAQVGTGSMVLLVDAADQQGVEPLRVDQRLVDGWRRVSVDDRTASLRRRGIVTVSLEDPVVVRLFGRERVWLRLRPEPVGDASAAPGGGGARPWAPVVHGLYLNAVEIRHARTVENEILGSSIGEPGMTVELAEQPVLPDTVRLRVRERLSDEERAALEAEHKSAVGADLDPSDAAVLSGLTRAPGSWVLWRRVDSLIGQDGDARVYVLDSASGRVTFGDGRSGRIPPAGRDSIRAFSYQQGGGEAGNLPAWSAPKLTSAVEGVETVVLPVDMVGGFGGLGADSLLANAPDRLRHAGRALSPADVEVLAVTSSADIVRAHCARPSGPGKPMQVTLAVRDGSRCPVPTLAQRDAVADFVRKVGWGGLGDGSIEVKGPSYAAVAVTVHLLAPRTQLADVEQTAKTILIKLFHPIDGGPDGSGWRFGRRPTSTDLLRALSEVDGLDRVDSIDITSLSDRSLDQLPADGLVCAETTDITVIVNSIEGVS